MTNPLEPADEDQPEEFTEEQADANPETPSQRLARLAQKRHVATAERVVRSMQPQIEAARRAVAAGLAPQVAALHRSTATALAPVALQISRGLQAWLEEHQEVFAAAARAAAEFASYAPALRELARLGAELGQWWETVRPTNWPDSTDLIAVIALASDPEHALPVVHVPGPGLLAALLAAPDPAARRVLLADRAEEALDAAEEVACGVTHAGVAFLRASLLEALTAARSGTWYSAQCAAATLVEVLAVDLVGKPSLAAVRKELEPMSRTEFTFPHLREDLTLLALRPAVRRYFPGDPVPVEFNRHATIHSGDPAQFTVANAVHGLLLATSMLKTIEELA